MQPHGQVELYWHDDILVGHYSGAFNLDGLEAARQKTHQHLASVNFVSWYRIIIYAEDAFASPEVIAQANNNELEDQALGCKGIVHVVPSDFHRGVRQSVSVAQGKEFTFVSNLEQAIAVIDQLRTSH